MMARMRPGPGVLYALLGAAIGGVLARAPDLLAYGAEQGGAALAQHIAWQYLVSLLVGLVLAAVLHLGRAHAGGPGRFLLLLVPASVTASWLACVLFRSVRAGHPAFDVAPQAYVAALISVLLWGGVFGWLSVLARRRQAARRLFGALMARRALLARQVVHAELAAERAQVDPEHVARVLRQVQVLYGHAPAQAAATLDQLVDSLRKAKRGKG